jgi:hypothetical protein
MPPKPVFLSGVRGYPNESKDPASASPAIGFEE